ncbi:C2H2-like zinc finger protein [Striga asiatica]|uniref:C2H2-like zinc finger protein n=1 Tax=Striga asiatica TaxID=4170 RepID=A0A5A7PGZ1_STRAF|nr:C2H2-like zinc finger protein [Striga asiatica]
MEPQQQEQEEEENHQREIQLLSPPQLDLQLSISVGPRLLTKVARKQDVGPEEALRWEAAEQIRLAAAERAYAERVRELTRREMEAAHNEFARARAMWQRAREMEVTCHSCRNKFRP